MKKSRHGSKKSIAIMAAVVVFAAATGGTLLGCGKTTDTGKNPTENGTESDQKQGGSEVQGNTGEAKKDTTDNSTDSTDKSAADDQNGVQNNANGGTENGMSTFDASYQEDDTIHRYEVILQDCNWQDAYQACIDRGGYLVRINSNTEYEFIRKQVVAQDATNKLLYIGGRRDSGSQDYYWVNQDNQLFGEKLNADSSWCSDEWQQGEPSFQDGSTEELYMNMFFLDKEKRFVWNDIPDDMVAAEPAYSGVIGYICEYE